MTAAFSRDSFELWHDCANVEVAFAEHAKLFLGVSGPERRRVGPLVPKLRAVTVSFGQCGSFDIGLLLRVGATQSI
ncbi:MAG: hypothetical protein AMJ69_03420 [Gammaproteobacteria bacterium SG8_47]|nr:MAG: hypothetical protein AMJ69_03420 [Gammaproteobacteria bacterium SG8_47]